MHSIASTPDLRSLTHIYCCGVAVIQRGYLVPDYCNPIFKCLFHNDNGANVLKMEALVWTKLNALLKHYINGEVLKVFHCGPRPLPIANVRVRNAAETLISATTPATLSSCATTPTCISPSGPVLASGSVPAPVSSVSTKIMPYNILTNTIHDHVSMSYGVYKQSFDSRAAVPRSKSLVGSNWGFLEGRANLDCNSSMLLSENESVYVPPNEIKAQFEAHQIGEGSAFSFGGGEISITFPIIAMFHSSAGSALTLKESAYAVPIYMCKDESLQLRISCEPIGTHKSFAVREFLCFPLRVRSKARAENTKLIAGARHDVIRWPEIPFRLNAEIPFKFKQPRTGNVLCYGMILPNFIAIFMDEHSVYASQAENLETDIALRYTTDAKWNSIQTITAKEKYMLVMLLGSRDALRMLLQPSRLVAKLKELRVEQTIYETPGTPIMSAFAIAFTLSCHMKLLYDITYDLCLNLLTVATGHSGWHNSDIREGCAKLMRIQDLLAYEGESAGRADDAVVLGKQVPISPL